MDAGVTDLAVLLDRVVRGFSRYHKFVLGSRTAPIQLVVLVAASNARRAERVRWLPVLSGRPEELKIPANLAKLERVLQRGHSVALAFEIPHERLVGSVRNRWIGFLIEPAAQQAGRGLCAKGGSRGKDA